MRERATPDGHPELAQGAGEKMKLSAAQLTRRDFTQLFLGDRPTPRRLLSRSDSHRTQSGGNPRCLRIRCASPGVQVDRRRPQNGMRQKARVLQSENLGKPCRFWQQLPEALSVAAGCVPPDRTLYLCGEIHKAERTSPL